MLVALCTSLVCGTPSAIAQGTDQHSERDIIIQPFATNIVHVTLRLSGESASSTGGLGIVGKPNQEGWTQSVEKEGKRTYQSDRMIVQVTKDRNGDRARRGIPLDDLNNSLRARYFPNTNERADPRYGTHNDSIIVTDTHGRTLLNLQNWSIAPNKTLENDTSQNAPKPEGFHVSATFNSPGDEHYYGLGQQQQGLLDLRDHQIKCWHDYGAFGGENVCVPFMVSSRSYGLMWDNPSKTTINLGFQNVNTWSSDVADEISFFVISGNTFDEIYSGYRQLTGVTHLLPKAAYGFIQSKAIYATQQQVLDVAKGYRQRNLPADVLVVDFLNMTRQGEMDLDPKRWPNPKAMNDELHGMGFTTMLSVWPHFSKGTQFYDLLKTKGWLVSRPDGTPDLGGYVEAIGPNIDSTNPEASLWFWNQIRDRYVKPDHFDYVWLDETEPDVDPVNDLFSIGSGPRFYNVFPLLHTGAIYDGFRRDFGDKRRVFSLARAAYLGAQRNGTVFWSSDIVATWDMLRRSVPAGLNFTASGMPYWNTDIGGFFSPSLPPDYIPEYPPLISPAAALDNVGRYTDYPELFVRWFQWGTFQPVLRTHGERQHNEVWSYGPQAEAILSKYLRLRYTLLPYTYSAAHQTYLMGAPYMRAFFMDFGGDPLAANITDEYMYGHAFLVAPVLEQGKQQRSVYLPAGADWYDFWTHTHYKGGQTILIEAPIDTLPLFVRAGSIIPMGSEIESSKDKQGIQKWLVFPGADATFDLYDDDGLTYDYERKQSAIVHCSWNDRSGRFLINGNAIEKNKDSALVEIVGR